jgi:hypothetical protein
MRKSFHSAGSQNGQGPGVSRLLALVILGLNSMYSMNSLMCEEMKYSFAEQRASTLRTRVASVWSCDTDSYT